MLQEGAKNFKHFMVLEKYSHFKIVKSFTRFPCLAALPAAKSTRPSFWKDY